MGFFQNQSQPTKLMTTFQHILSSSSICLAFLGLCICICMFAHTKRVESAVMVVIVWCAGQLFVCFCTFLLFFFYFCQAQETHVGPLTGSFMPVNIGVMEGVYGLWLGSRLGLSHCHRGEMALWQVSLVSLCPSISMELLERWAEEVYSHTHTLFGEGGNFPEDSQLLPFQETQCVWACRFSITTRED